MHEILLHHICTLCTFCNAHRQYILSILTSYLSLSDLRFLHPYKECFVPFFNRCEISQSTLFWDPGSRWHTTWCPSPFWGSTSSLAPCSVFDSYTICTRLSLLLANIVFFQAFPFKLPLKVFRTCLLGVFKMCRGFHTLISIHSPQSPLQPSCDLTHY